LFVLIKASITPEESILQNLDTWCYEVGTRFEYMNIEAALDCINYIDDLGLDYQIADLGCGDGAATKVFHENKFLTLAIDINEYKLEKVPGTKICIDLLEFLESTKKLNNIFSHHAFEHIIDIERAINIIGEKMNVGCLYYVIVPAGDYLHSVHHVVFESPKELLPKGFKPLKLEKQYRDEMEFICVAQKLGKE